MVNEPVKDSPDGGMAVESAPRRASLLRVLRVMAMTVVVLVEVCLAAPEKIGPPR
jgi:hypothetical protein